MGGGFVFLFLRSRLPMVAPLLLLQWAWAGLTLSRVGSPPSAAGTMWSSSLAPGPPHMWQSGFVASSSARSCFHAVVLVWALVGDLRCLLMGSYQGAVVGEGVRFLGAGVLTHELTPTTRGSDSVAAVCGG